MSYPLLQAREVLRLLAKEGIEGSVKEAEPRGDGVWQVRHHHSLSIGHLEKFKVSLQNKEAPYIRVLNSMIIKAFEKRDLW